MIQEAAKQRVISLILFFGPTGMFFIPLPGIGSFRLFYVFCIALLFLYLWQLPLRIVLRLAVLLLIVAAFYVSAAYGTFQPRAEQIGIAQQPLIRAAVIAVLLCSFFLVSEWLAKARNAEEVAHALYLTYLGFCTVFVLGTLIYIASLSGVLPLSVYTHVVSLQQTGYGYMRLSPGTYPNEFGILCSFYGCFALYLYLVSKRWIFVLMSVLFVGGLLLTSTRTAYIAFVIGFITLLVAFPSARGRVRLFTLGLASTPIIIAGLTWVGFDAVGVVKTGYKAALGGEGTLNARTTIWETAGHLFLNHQILGLGFEAPEVSFLHNLPLQVVFGLGFLGVAVVVALFSLFAVIQFRDPEFSVWSDDELSVRCVRLLRFLLLEHVLIFGLTNHNQTHFLTWLLFSLVCVRLRTSQAGGHNQLALTKKNRLD